MLAEEMVDGAGRAGRAGRRRLDRARELGDGRSVVTEGFMDYWEENRPVFRVVELATEEGDRRSGGSGCGP